METELSVGVDITTSLPAMINHSGRVSTDYLSNIATSRGFESFLLFVNCAVLASSALKEGTLHPQPNPPRQPIRQRARTLMFRPAELIEQARLDADAEPLHRAIYPLVKGPESANSDPSLFTVGREPGNDLVVPDFAISREHALLRIRGSRVFVNDRGSSNGTFVNGNQVGVEQVEIIEGDTLRFGRLTFVLLMPRSLYDLLTRKEGV
jgi:hypothetical protein